MQEKNGVKHSLSAKNTVAKQFNAGQQTVNHQPPNQPGPRFWPWLHR